jgi:hypothetical protein
MVGKNILWVSTLARAPVRAAANGSGSKAVA